MLQIAVCDDDKFLCADLEQTLLDLESSFPDKFEVEVFYNGEDLWQSMRTGYEADIIFLDIELQYLNGVELGNLIRNDLGNEQVQIVYISNYESYAMELFQVRPLHFLKKPLELSTIQEVLEKAWMLLEKQKRYYLYWSGKTMNKVLVSDILYASSQGKKVILHLTSGNKEFYGKLDDVVKQLQDANFLSIHKSYLVNFAHISAIRRNEVVLTNGETLPVSNSKRDSVQQFVVNTMRGPKLL